MTEDENSCYSNDEEYFLDVCRAGELQELKDFVSGLTEETPFDWTCISNGQDNFLHMLAANNLTEVFDYLFPIVVSKITPAQLQELLNKQNSTGNTPLHYAVITDSKPMVLKLLEAGVSTNILNECNRTPFAEAEEFDKIEIAEILAPLTFNNIEQLRKQVQLLDVCHEDSDDDEQEQSKPEKKEEKIEKKQ